MNDLIVDPFANQQVRVSDMAYGFIEHSGDGSWLSTTRLSGLVSTDPPKK